MTKWSLPASLETVAEHHDLTFIGTSAVCAWNHILCGAVGASDEKVIDEVQAAVLLHVDPIALGRRGRPRCIIISHGILQHVAFCRLDSVAKEGRM
jgi:hypothetical protein